MFRTTESLEFWLSDNLGMIDRQLKQLSPDDPAYKGMLIDALKFTNGIDTLHEYLGSLDHTVYPLPDHTERLKADLLRVEPLQLTRLLNQHFKKVGDKNG